MTISTTIICVLLILFLLYIDKFQLLSILSILGGLAGVILGFNFIIAFFFTYVVAIAIGFLIVAGTVFTGIIMEMCGK